MGQKMMRIVANIFLALLVGSCSHAQSNASMPLGYGTKISGLFIQDSAGPICQMEVTFSGDVDDSVGKVWKDRQNLKLLATGIGRDKGRVKMVFASPEVCAPEGMDKAHERLEKILGPMAVRLASPLVLSDSDREQKNLGLLDINASDFASGVMKQCKINREFKKEISYEDLIDIRYGMAIPLIFYLHSGDREFIAFDSNCEFKDEFINLIDENYK